MTERPDCAQTRELMPELAAAIAYGGERAQALEHLAECPACRRELDETARVVDDLLLLAPEREPPAGFEASVMARLTLRPRRFPRARTLVAQVAVIALAVGLTAGVVWRQTSDERRLAADYRETLSVANGRYLTAAPLRRGAAEVGHVFAYQGSPSWVFVTVEDAQLSGTYRVTLLADGSREYTLGKISVADGVASWGRTVDVPVSRIRLIQLSGPRGPAMVAPFW
ncbi:MAG: anti-sigma factor family protein [Carbonactinosporaceae bacterium]